MPARIGVMERVLLPWLTAVEDTVPALHTVFVLGTALAPQEIPTFTRVRVRHVDALLQQGTSDDIHVEVTYHDLGMITYYAS